METMDWVLYILVGPVIALIAFIFQMFPPKKINQFYGYRTKRSMQNEETWKEAQVYANKWMLRLFIAASIIDLPLFLMMEIGSAVFIGVGLLTSGCILLVVITEMHLKKKFGK